MFGLLLLILVPTAIFLLLKLFGKFFISKRRDGSVERKNFLIRILLKFFIR